MRVELFIYIFSSFAANNRVFWSFREFNYIGTHTHTLPPRIKEGSRHLDPLADWCFAGPTEQHWPKWPQNPVTRFPYYCIINVPKLANWWWTRFTAKRCSDDTFIAHFIICKYCSCVEFDDKTQALLVLFWCSFFFIHRWNNLCCHKGGKLQLCKLN